jgi:hypothetical protein
LPYRTKGFEVEDFGLNANQDKWMFMEVRQRTGEWDKM